jgi:SulP family sulfate permease
MATTSGNPRLLGVEKEQSGTTLIVRLSGELDVASGRKLETVLEGHDGSESLVLDLASLKFIDSAGLRTIYELWTVARDDGLSVTITGVSGQVRGVMGVTGLDEILPLAE